MDIRNFFGNRSGAAVSASSTSSSIISQKVDLPNNNGATKKRKIIMDDEETLAVDTEFIPSVISPVIDSTKVANEQNKVTDAHDGNSVDIPATLSDLICWNAGEKVPYIALVNTFEKIESISSRLEKENLFSNLFRTVILTTPSDLTDIVYLASNTVFPAFEGLELGIGDALLIKAVVESTGRNTAAVKAAYDKDGDLGIVASQSRTHQSTLGFALKPKPLTAAEVLEELRNITRTIGGKSMDKKVGIIKKMMVRCQKNEAKYLVRALQGKLRIGTAFQTVLVALAHAFALSPPKTVTLKMKERCVENIDVAEEETDEEEDKDKSNNNTVEATKEKDTGDNQIEDVKEDKETILIKTVTPEADASIQIETIVNREEIEPEEAHKLRSKLKLTRSIRLELSVNAVKRAFSECPSINKLVDALLVTPLYDLHKVCRLLPGIPVAPMLAKPTKSLEDVLKRLSGELFTMEYKYDGERAQVHILEDGSAKIFSRNSEDNSNKYPELVDVVKRARKEGITSCVVDAEVVAYDREKGCLLPFQVLSTRKRKVEEGEEMNQKVKVVLQAFDLLLVNGRSLLREPLKIRRDLLLQSFDHHESYFHFATGMDCMEDGDTTPIETFMQEACAAQCEGLMVKTLLDRATYEPSRRSTNWLKLKKDYIDGMGVCDSVDLVPLGGYRGRGKRCSVYGAFLMACYDPDRDEFQSVCKVGTGFKDEDLQRLFELMQTKVTPNHRRPINFAVDSTLEPDDWFEASEVWELAAADLSRSSVHRGGIGRLETGSGRGVGLRFPRFLRERPDKKPENATSSEQIVEMFLSQGEGGDSTVTNGGGGGDDYDEDLI